MDKFVGATLRGYLVYFKDLGFYAGKHTDNFHICKKYAKDVSKGKVFLSIRGASIFADRMQHFKTDNQGNSTKVAIIYKIESDGSLLEVPMGDIQSSSSRVLAEKMNTEALDPSFMKTLLESADIK